MAHFCSTQSPILHQVNSDLFSQRRQGSLKAAKACQGPLRPQLTRAGEIGLPLGWRCCKVAEGTAVRITAAVFAKKKKKIFQSSSQEQYQLAFNAWHIMQGQWLCSPFTILLAIILKAIQIFTNTGRLLLSRKTQTARYFSSKGGFIRDQQRIAIWDLQPWWAISHYPPVRKGESSWRVEKEIGRARVNTELMAFHWLRPCQERREVFLLTFELCCHHRAWCSQLFPHLVSPLYLTELSVY